MSDFKERLSAVRFNPVLMNNLVMDELSAQLNNSADYDVPDPSNPFVFLMEAAVLTTSVGITEGEGLLRRTYPSMAITEEELYLHMADTDYLGRFATPAWTTFEIYLSKTEFIQRAVAVGTQGVRQLTIPRQTAFTIAETTFTLQYPIHIRLMSHGGIQVVYDTDKVSPIQTLDSNMVDWTTVKLNSGELLLLRVPVGQFKITTFTETLNAASGFDASYVFEDNFYYARVFLTDTNGSWSEIKTTHTEQVYDIQTPTAVLQVVGNVLNVSLPLIYFSLGYSVGEIRVDIYTTKGKIELDPGSYQASQFTYEMIDIDDDPTYVSPLQNFTRFSVLNPNLISGGSVALTFEELRRRTLSRTLGDSQQPITAAQLETRVQTRGYTLVTNIDNITNRQFLATRRLSPPSDGSVVSGMGCTMGQVQSTMEALTLSTHVVDNGNRITILPTMLYRFVNGVIKTVSDTDIAYYNALPSDTLARTINSGRFIFTPLHYVLDATSAAFDVRPYYMDQPKVVRKVFVDENNTALYQASVDSYDVTRIEGGYRIIVKLKSGDTFKELTDDKIVVQMGYKPVGENSYASINGTMIGLSDDERVYQFDLLTRFDIDSQDNLYTTNWSMFDEFQHDFACELEDDFAISFIIVDQVVQGYQSSELDSLVQIHLLPSSFMVISRESLRIRLGYSLIQLWRRNRTLVTEESYQRYTANVPYYYTENIYERDVSGQVIIEIEEDGDLVYSILHYAGDPVLDEEGNQVYRYLAGDVVLDGNGEPVLVESRKLLREFTLLLMEGCYYFVTDNPSINYLNAVPMQIINWIENDLGVINQQLLEQSELYFHPTVTIGDTIATVREEMQVSISLDQTFFVRYYMTDVAYSNISLREALTQSTKVIVSELMGKNVVSLSEIITRLRENAGDEVISIEAGGIGGSNNFNVVSIKDNAVRMSLRKRLTVLNNQLLAVQDDIDINFLRHTTIR